MCFEYNGVITLKRGNQLISHRFYDEDFFFQHTDNIIVQGCPFNNTAGGVLNIGGFIYNNRRISRSGANGSFSALHGGFYHCSASGDHQQIHAWMTPGELCYYVSHFYETWDQAHARYLARRFGLAWEQQVGLMSGGQQRKVSILLALAARPEVLMLDEPAAGLDPIARRELVDEIVDVLSRDGGCTVLFSTHIISDLERIAEHVGIMDRGRIVAAASLEELQRTTKRVQVIFDDAAPPEGFSVPGAVHSETAGSVVTAVVRLVSDTQLDALREIPGARVSVFPLGLEDIFIELLGPAAPAELSEVQS